MAALGVFGQLLGQYGARGTVKQLHGDGGRADIDRNAVTGLGACERRDFVPGQNLGRPSRVHSDRHIAGNPAGTGQSNAVCTVIGRQEC